MRLIYNLIYFDVAGHDESVGSSRPTTNDRSGATTNLDRTVFRTEATPRTGLGSGLDLEG